MSVGGVGGAGRPQFEGDAGAADAADAGTAAGGAAAATPFFARFLEGQGSSATALLTEKFPSDSEDSGTRPPPPGGNAVTLKYPSDSEDGGSGGSPGGVAVTRKFPSDSEDSGGGGPTGPGGGMPVTRKFPSDHEDSGGGIPGDMPHTVTEAVGEFGREVSGMLGDRLKHENDAGMVRTLDRFLDMYDSARWSRRAGGPKANDPDFNAAFGGLAQGKLLDDLAIELFLDDLEYTKANPNAAYYGRINTLSDAICKFGNANLKEAWAKTGAKLQDLRPDEYRNGRIAGAEGAREIRTAVADKNNALMLDVARDLQKGVKVAESFPPQIRADKYQASKFNATIRNSGKQGTLDEFVRALRRTDEGKRELSTLNAFADQHGTPTVKRAWAEAMNATTPPTTRKFPSDEEDSGGGPGGLPPRPVTLKWPSDNEG